MRPPNQEGFDPFDTNTKYCHYDEPHNDYLYQDEWVEFIVQLLATPKLSLADIRKFYKDGEKLDILVFE